MLGKVKLAFVVIDKCKLKNRTFIKLGNHLPVNASYVNKLFTARYILFHISYLPIICTVLCLFMSIYHHFSMVNIRFYKKDSIHNIENFLGSSSLFCEFKLCSIEINNMNIVNTYAYLNLSFNYNYSHIQFNCHGELYINLYCVLYYMYNICIYYQSTLLYIFNLYILYITIHYIIYITYIKHTYLSHIFQYFQIIAEKQLYILYNIIL